MSRGIAYNDAIKLIVKSRFNKILERIKDEYLNLIVGIGFDYDGYNDADNLKGVIDELVKYAKKALNNDDSSIIYSGTNKKYNILNEELEGKNDN